MKTALSQIRFKGKIDALNFYAEKAPNLHKRQFDHAHGARGFPVHDPTLGEIEQLRVYPLRYLEVAVDAHPQKSVAPAARRQALKCAYEVLASSLYPWNGPLMVPDARSFDGTETKGVTNRLPEFNLDEDRAEGVYYGHKGDPVQMILYYKVKDQRGVLTENKRVVRLELKVEEEGLRHLGLNKVGDLLQINFRTVFGRYFHCAKPVLNGMNTHSKFYRHGDAKLLAVIKNARLRHSTQEINEQVGRGGMHSLHDHAAVKKNSRAGHEYLNRRIREPLSRIL